MIAVNRAFIGASCIAMGMVIIILSASPCRAQQENARNANIQQLIEQLKSPSPFARLAAAGQVAQLGPDGAEAAAALIEALKCERIELLFPNPQIEASRQRFADALVRIGETISPELAKALNSENGLVRVWAAYSLYKIDAERQRSKVVPVLVQALSENDEVAMDAALVLELMGRDAAEAIPDLMEQLDRRELAVRCGMAHALAAVAQGDSADPLIQALEHDNHLVRVGAALVLHRVRPEQSAAVHKTIAAALEDESRQVRQQAVWAIGQMGTAAAPLADELIGALPSLEPDPRDYFFGGGVLGRQSSDPAMALAATGPACKPALIDALESDNVRVRLIAAIALVRLEPGEAGRVAPIFEAARNDADQVIAFLAGLQSAPAENPGNSDIESLVESLMENYGFGRPSPATFQLAQRGAEAVEPLMNVLRRGDGLAAQRASNILGRIGEPALPALTEAMRSDNDQLRVFSVAALAAMGEPALPELAKALHDEVYPVRRAARYALLSIGSPEALDALRKADGNP